MNLVSLMGVIEQGLVYSLMAFGSYISFKILNIADLTVDGSFVLGSAVCAIFAANNMPLAGIFLAVLAGALAGLVTALLQTKLGILPMLSGILTMTGLYTVNLIVMGGKANVHLLNKETIFTYANTLLNFKAYKIVTLIVIIGVVLVFLSWFFKTQLGLSIRATGDNESMCKASSINIDFVKFVAFAISNSIVALSGALIAQMQQSADMMMGSGMVVISFASIIIGSVLIKNKNVTIGFLSVVVGSVIYRFIIALVLSTNFPASYLKLISALIVVIALSVPTVKNQIQIYRLSRVRR